MSLARFVGLLMFISVDVQKGLGQTALQPRCSNPQGIYVTEEGSTVEVCISLFNGFGVPGTITLVTEGTSNLGNAATGGIDFMNDTFRVNVGSSDQDVFEICPVIEIYTDKVIERTEYFTVSLRSSERERIDLATCQVAIIDRSGGPSDCYEAALSDISLAEVVNDKAFCFMEEDTQCLRELNSNMTTASDCTRWNQTSIRNVLITDAVVGQILPNISAISGECVENVLDVVSKLSRKGSLNSPPPRQECVTNCVLTVRNSKSCDTSVLLLEEVFRDAVTDTLNGLRTKQPGVCIIGLQCCDQSQPLPSICGESPADPLPASTVTVQVTSTVQVTGTASQGQASVETVTVVIITAAVLGSVLGLLLIGGAVALIIFLILTRRCRSPSHKEVISAIQVGIGDHQTKKNQLENTNEYATIDRESTVMMETNCAYMCRPTHGQEILTSDNIAYYSSNGTSNEDNHDYVYEYV